MWNEAAESERKKKKRSARETTEERDKAQKNEETKNWAPNFCWNRI